MIAGGPVSHDGELVAGLVLAEAGRVDVLDGVFDDGIFIEVGEVMMCLHR